MEPFVNGSTSFLKDLETRLDTASKAVDNIATNFSYKTGEGADTAQEIFQLLSRSLTCGSNVVIDHVSKQLTKRAHFSRYYCAPSFLADFTAAHDYNTQEREKRERDERLKKATEERNAARKQSVKPTGGKRPGKAGSKVPGKPEKKDLFEQFEDSRKGDAESIVNEIALRMQNQVSACLCWHTHFPIYNTNPPPCISSQRKAMKGEDYHSDGYSSDEDRWNDEDDTLPKTTTPEATKLPGV